MNGSIVIIFLMFLIGCNSQEVVEEVNADIGVMKLSFEESKGINFGNILPDEIYNEVITLENLGGFELSKISSSSLNDVLRYKGGKYPGTGGSCSDSLSSGESCTIVIEVNSNKKTEVDSQVIIKYHDGVYSQYKSFPVKASIGNPGNITYGTGEYSTLDDLLENLSNPAIFDTTAVGLNNTKLITIGNTGDRDVTINKTEFTSESFDYNGGNYPGTNGSCSNKLPAGNICTIEVNFNPLQAKSYSDYLNIEYFNGTTDDNGLIGLAGESINNFADLRYNFPNGYDFGDVPLGKKVTQFINVINDTIVDATDVSHSITTNNGDIGFDPTFPGPGGSCSSTIQAGNSCSLEMSINANNLGAQSETLTISYYNNNVFSPETKTVELTVTANVKTIASLNYDNNLSTPVGTADTFPTQSIGSSITHTFMFVNTGGFEATNIGTGNITDPSGTLNVIVGGTCGTTKKRLIPNEGCTIRVRATNANAGVYNANLTIAYNNGLGDGSANSTTTLPLTSRFVDVSNLSYIGSSNQNFGDVLNLSTSKNFTVTLQNTRTGDATGLNFDFTAFNTTDFNLVSNTCSGTLTGSSTCELTFNITPTTLGVEFVTIPLSYTDLLGTKNLNLNISVNSKNPAKISIATIDGTDITNLDFSDSPIGKSVKKSFLLKNTGGLTARMVTMAITGTNYTLSNDGTCGGSINNITIVNGDSCVFEITFNPSTLSTYNENIDISFHDGGNIKTSNFTLSGQGANSGYLEVTDASYFTPINIGQSTVSVQLSYNLTFENKGTADVDTLVFNPLSTQFTIGSNNCLGTIPQGSTCTVEVLFTPDSPSTYTQQINYSYNSSVSTKTDYFSIEGRGLTYPDINIIFTGPNQPNNYDFSDVPLLLSEYLTININNLGQTTAENLILTIDQGAQNSYSIASTNCPNNLSGSSGCQILIQYSPEDINTHNAKLQINYDGLGNQILPLNINFEGKGVSPLSNFIGWSEIYASSGNSNGTSEVRIKWDSMTSQSSGITIDGYKVYQNINAPLPTGLNSLEGFEVATITGNTDSDREYNLTGLTEDNVYHFAIRPMYLGQVMDTDDSVSIIKVITPPKNMSLVHPIMVNRDFCQSMSLSTVADKNLGCAYNGIGSEDGYFSEKDYLFVDNYELSENRSSEVVNESGNFPVEFINQFAASIACKDFSDNFQGEIRTKRLLTRSEWVWAAAWPEMHSIALVNSIENDNGANDCKINQVTPSRTGDSSNCKSKFGIYDMVGNLWEWNSDQINGTIGWNSSIDGNNELFGANLGGGLFPDLITNMPCFNYSAGIAQAITSEVCPNGITGASITNILDDFYFPPVGQGLKSVRSGGSIGLPSSFTSRRGGRYVGDFNVNVSNVTSYTGARCAFSIKE